MPLVSDNFHKKKLDSYNINIKTKYIVNNDILERNTDSSINQDIKNGIICEKEYYVNNNLKHIEKNFDSRIEYTFISKEDHEKEYSCPNCGVTSSLKNFIDGCPYCKSYYNIDYTDKDLGSKYHYDLILKSSKYRIITAFVDLIISLIIAFIFIKLTSRTFNSYDISKIFIYGFILALILYYLFYILDAYVVLYPIKIYKDKQNKKQINFWNRTKIDKKKFFNNLNYEIRKKLYNDSNIIDYDILDYIDFRDFYKDSKMCVEVTLSLRLIYYINNKIVPKYLISSYVLKRHDNGIIELKNGVNIIKCQNCGASIDVTKGYCEFCKSEIKYLQEWIIDD